MFRHLPYFFVGVNSTWIYEFAAHFDKNPLSNCEIDTTNMRKQLTQLMQRSLQANWLQTSPFQKNFE